MGGKKMLTTQEAAEHMGVAYQTVMAWVYQGKFPNAEKMETPRGIYYLIPATDINGFERPKRGRPAKPQPVVPAQPAPKKSGRKAA